MRRRSLAAALAILFAASAALARTTFHDLAVADAVKNGAGHEKLLAVRYFMAGEKHAAVAKDLGTFTANKRTNAFNKSDEAACQIAFLSALISLQSRAQQLGGDAVVDIKSITRNQELSSATQFRCVAGTTVANVVLTGRVVKLR